MARQLNIRNDEAYETAHNLARRTHMTTTEVVVKALRRLNEETPVTLDDMTPEQRARYERIMAIAREGAKHKTPGATSDHSDMYDENGLPI
jgi:hypothetical protein